MIEQDVDPHSSRQQRRDFGQQVFGQVRQTVELQARPVAAAPGAIEFGHLRTLQIDSPVQRQLHCAQLQVQADKAAAVGEVPHLAALLDVIVMQTDRLQRMRFQVLAAQAVVQADKQQSPASNHLHLGHKSQQKAGDGLLDGRARPGAAPEEIGQGVLVGVRPPQHPREGRQRLVLGRTYQQAFDDIQGMLDLGFRKADQQREQELAQRLRMRDNPSGHGNLRRVWPKQPTLYGRSCALST